MTRQWAGLAEDYETAGGLHSVTEPQKAAAEITKMMKVLLK